MLDMAAKLSQLLTTTRPPALSPTSTNRILRQFVHDNTYLPSHEELADDNSLDFVGDVLGSFADLSA